MVTHCESPKQLHFYQLHTFTRAFLFIAITFRVDKRGVQIYTEQFFSLQSF